MFLYKTFKTSALKNRLKIEPSSKLNSFVQTVIFSSLLLILQGVLVAARSSLDSSIQDAAQNTSFGQRYVTQGKLNETSTIEDPRRCTDEAIDKLPTTSQDDFLNNTLNIIAFRSRRNVDLKPEASTEASLHSFEPMSAYPIQLTDEPKGSASILQDPIEGFYSMGENSPHLDNGFYIENPGKSDNLSTSETVNKGLMVLIKSKSGQFSRIVPLEDLIVTPTSQLNQPIETQQETSDQQNNVEILPQKNTDEQPTLAELIAAGTAMGIQMSNLARANSNSSLMFDGSAQNNLDRGESRNIDQSTKEPPLETAMEYEMPDRVPESMESLVRSSEQDDLVDPTDETDLSSSNNLVRENGERSKKRRSPQQRQTRRRQNPNRRASVKLDESSDDDDMSELDDGSYESSLEGEPNSDNRRRRLMARRRNESNEDLKTAAGHYYGKKKKKKKIKKKKIVIVKKKKKKVKKYKKIKKVKVVKKKKKKVKKYHHHHHGHGHGHGYGGGYGHGGGHEHGHDHGKYYMYAKVPKKGSWEFGFKKGNKKHWIERHEKGHKNKFKTKVKWYDKKSKGKGVHIWDYNHYDKKKYHG